MSQIFAAGGDWKTEEKVHKEKGAEKYEKHETETIEDSYIKQELRTQVLTSALASEVKLTEEEIIPLSVYSYEVGEEWSKQLKTCSKQLKKLKKLDNIMNSELEKWQKISEKCIKGTEELESRVKSWDARIEYWKSRTPIDPEDGEEEDTSVADKEEKTSLSGSSSYYDARSTLES